MMYVEMCKLHTVDPLSSLVHPGVYMKSFDNDWRHQGGRSLSLVLRNDCSSEEQ